MTVKTRNEKYRPGISKAASCQAHRGSSRGGKGEGAGGLVAAFCPVSPVTQRFLIKLGQMTWSALPRGRRLRGRMLGSQEVSTGPQHPQQGFLSVGLCLLAAVAGEGGGRLQALDRAEPGTALKSPKLQLWSGFK